MDSTSALWRSACPGERLVPLRLPPHPPSERRAHTENAATRDGRWRRLSLEGRRLNQRLVVLVTVSDVPSEGRCPRNSDHEALVLPCSRIDRATRRGYCSWDVNHASWVVTLSSPEEQTFYGRTLEEALAWCLVWLMAPELGVGPFRI
jgi:hypothetical protein